MSQVRGRNTGPEIRVRQMAHALGLRFRLHRADLPGKPDLVFPKYRTVIFVHGCFWHRHPNCKKATLPKSSTHYWQEKFSRNVSRDSAVQESLISKGWKVEVIWECETRMNNILCAKFYKIFGIYSKLPQKQRWEDNDTI
jgi:DNA mismatch endonuclease, patch repair protein